MHTFVGDMGLRSFGTGKSLLWIHGLGESSLCFESVIRQSALKAYTHWLVDLPGYGRSRWTEPLSLPETATLLAPVFELTGCCMVVGHSMGGVLAVMMAEQFGIDHIEAIVNIEGNLSLGDCQYSGRVAGCTEQDFLKWGRRELLDGLYHRGIVDEAHRGYYAGMRLADPRAVYLHSNDLVALSESETMVERMESLDVPSYYLAGVPHGICKRTLELLSASQISHDLIDPSGHWPFIDRPADFAEKLSDWLNRGG